MQIFGTKPKAIIVVVVAIAWFVAAAASNKHSKSCCALLLGILGKGAMIASIIEAIAVATTILGSQEQLYEVRGKN